jgi:hypothetical protein
MANALFMNVSHTGQYLAHVVANGLHRDISFVLLCLLDFLLQVCVAVFKYQILHDRALLALRVKNVKHLHNMFTSFQSVQHLEFSAKILARL